MLVKMTKTQVIAHVRKHGSWNGLVCPNKMFPIIGRTAMHLDLVHNDEFGICVKDETMLDLDSETYRYIPRSLEHFLLYWTQYNTSYEEGYYAAYYMIK